MKKKCACPAGSRWLEQAPESQHAYRVECMHCRKFIKWGAQTEANQLIEAGEEGEMVRYVPPPPRATLDEFFVD